MRKITKVINGFVISALIFVTLLLLPLGMSFWVKKNYLKLLGCLGHMHNIDLKLVKFERGWFVSDSLIQVTLPTVNKNNSPLQFMLKQRILNGPYLLGKIADKKRIYFAKCLIYNVSEEPNFVLHSSTLIHFNNTNETVLHANKINFTTRQQHINLQNLSFKVRYSPSNRQLTSDTTAKSLTISEQQNNFIIFNNLFLHNALQQKNSLCYGQRSLEADKLIYFNPQQSIQIEHMALQTQQTTTTDGATDLAIIVHAYKAKSNLFKITPVNIKLSLTQRNTAALGSFMATTLNLNHSGATDTEFLHQIYSSFLDVLSCGALLFLDQLTFSTEEGELIVHGELQFSKQNQITDLTNIMVGAKGKMEISMPLMRLTVQLNHLYQKKKVEIEGQDLKLDQVADQQIQYWLTNKRLISDTPNVNFKLIYDGENY